MEQVNNKTNGSILFAGIIILVVLSLIKFFNLSYPVTITNQSVATELSVIGEGKVEVVPNAADLSAGLTANGTTAKEVQDKINEANNKIVSAMLAFNIDKKDIKTSNYSINPSYNYEPGGTNSINGYTGNATITIKVKKTDQLPSMLQSATDAGANQVYTNYSVDNPEKYREEARNKAIENAREQAQKLASQLGIKLGKVTNIVESGGGGPVMYEKALAMPLDAGGGRTSASLEPGSQTITSTVTLFFERK